MVVLALYTMFMVAYWYSECWAPSGLDFRGLMALQVVIVVCPAICFEGNESL